MMFCTSSNTLLEMLSLQVTGRKNEVKRYALLLRMLPTGIPVQLFFRRSKSSVSGLAAFLSSINCRFEGVFDSLKEAKGTQKSAQIMDGCECEENLFNASI
jgi:hypothetical protein